MNGRGKHLLRLAQESILIFLLVALPACGTIQVPMEPIVGEMEAKRKLPVIAGLLLPDDTCNYVFEGKPESHTGSARQHSFPLGNCLEETSIMVFSQVFEEIDVVRTHEEAEKYEVYVEPTIEEFHFRYDQISYAGFAVAVISRINVHVVLANGERRIYDKDYESPEQREGPWVLNTEYEKEVGKSASKALANALEKAANEMINDPQLWRLFDRS